MAWDLRKHPFFETWKDPVSGIESFILTERVAPVQQSFYFTNPSVSADERWLWFYVAWPPAPHHALGAVCLDPGNPQIHVFPETAFTSASPMVAPEGDACYFCSGPSVWRKRIGCEPQVVCSLDDKWINRRLLRRLATHLTRSADGRYFLLDGSVGAHWFVAVGDITTGQVKVLHEFANHHNHAQFHPTDPNLFLIAQDWWHDIISGQDFRLDHRIWLMDVQQTRLEPIRPKDWYEHNALGAHEWWSADGLICWNDYQKGAYEYDPRTEQTRHVWPGPLCHAHCDSTRRYWCADESPYKWTRQPCQILFFDRQTNRQIAIASGLPQPPVPRGSYHIDPHPQFSPKDTFVVYTTTVRGKVDVALAPVAGVLDAMGKSK